MKKNFVAIYYLNYFLHGYLLFIFYCCLVNNLVQKSFLLEIFQLIMHKIMYKYGANKVLLHKHRLYIS